MVNSRRPRYVDRVSATELLATLPTLDTDELQRVESRIIELYRQRGEGILFDDEYGVLTETDRAVVAQEALDAVDGLESE